ncbi:hypothetical protein SNEBB_008268 [Seison nebaliae]|nr:hypothetical protein SNEBB_008268 [Seison nebaliae]
MGMSQIDSCLLRLINEMIDPHLTPNAVITKEIELHDIYPHYGEIYHGLIDRKQSENILLNENLTGSYLVRSSTNPPNSFTLDILFDGKVKNFKIKFDGTFHSVGHRKFISLNELVGDGLASFYHDQINSHKLTDEHSFDATTTVNSTIFFQPKLSSEMTSQTKNENRAKWKNKENKKKKKKDVVVEKDKRKMENEELDVNLSQAGEELIDRLHIVRHSQQHHFQTVSIVFPVKCTICYRNIFPYIRHELKCLHCGRKIHHKCLNDVIDDCIPRMKYMREMFGIDLTTFVRATDGVIPFVIKSCINEIEKRDLRALCGIYRKEGSVESMNCVKGIFRNYIDKFSPNSKKMKANHLVILSSNSVTSLSSPISLRSSARIESSSIINGKDKENESLCNLCTIKDVYAIACVLKDYLRSLPIPLITYELNDELMRLIDDDMERGREKMSFISKSNKDNFIHQLRIVLLKLPPIHLHTLRYVTRHFHEIQKYSDANGMSANTLAIVLKNVLIRMERNRQFSSSFHSCEMRIVETLISFHHQIFDEFPHVSLVRESLSMSSKSSTISPSSKNI